MTAVVAIVVGFLVGSMIWMVAWQCGYNTGYRWTMEQWRRTNQMVEEMQQERWDDKGEPW